MPAKGRKGGQQKRTRSVTPVPRREESNHEGVTSLKQIQMRALPLSLKPEEEQDVVNWYKENELYNVRMADFKSKGKIKRVIEEKAEQLGVAAEQLTIWLKSMRDRAVRLTKKQSSGTEAHPITDRDKWILENFGYMRGVTEESQNLPDDDSSNVPKDDGPTGEKKTQESVKVKEGTLKSACVAKAKPPRRIKKRAIPLFLKPEDEQDVVDWYKKDEFLYNLRMADYKTKTKRKEAIQEKAEQFGLTARQLSTWLKSMRDRAVKLSKGQPSGTGEQSISDRDIWVLENFGYCKDYTRMVPVRSQNLSEDASSDVPKDNGSTDKLNGDTEPGSTTGAYEVSQQSSIMSSTPISAAEVDLSNIQQSLTNVQTTSDQNAQTTSHHNVHSTSHQNGLTTYHQNDHQNVHSTYHQNDHQNVHTTYLQNDHQNVHTTYHQNDPQNVHTTYHQNDHQNVHTTYYQNDLQNVHTTSHQNDYQNMHTTSYQNVHTTSQYNEQTTSHQINALQPVPDHDDKAAARKAWSQMMFHESKLMDDETFQELQVAVFPILMQYKALNRQRQLGVPGYP